MNLQDAGLLKAYDTTKKWDWNKIKTELQLINEEFNPKIPQDISFVHNGFAPLSIRLIERLLEKKSLSLLVKQEGARLGLNETNCKVPANEARFFNNDQEAGRPAVFKRKQRILVYFLGGITYGEIAALRFLAKLKRVQFIIATTSIINAKSALQQMVGN